MLYHLQWTLTPLIRDMVRAFLRLQRRPRKLIDLANEVCRSVAIVG